MWYLIVSIHDLCPPSYFVSIMAMLHDYNGYACNKPKSQQYVEGKIVVMLTLIRAYIGERRNTHEPVLKRNLVRAVAVRKRII